MALCCGTSNFTWLVFIVHNSMALKHWMLSFQNSTSQLLQPTSFCVCDVCVFVCVCRDEHIKLLNAYSASEMGQEEMLFLWADQISSNRNKNINVFRFKKLKSLRVQCPAFNHTSNFNCQRKADVSFLRSIILSRSQIRIYDQVKHHLHQPQCAFECISSRVISNDTGRRTVSRDTHITRLRVMLVNIYIYIYIRFQCK